jgi:prevent-host-death family protein
MTRVGIREAKANLSRLLRQVASGEEVVITDHGRPVARLVRPAREYADMSDFVRDLERRGIIEPSTKPPLPLGSPIDMPKNLAREMLQQDRDA